MPTVGRINEGRNPLQESEMKYSLKLMREIAHEAGGLMAYGADVHGELTSNAYVDIMYPAGEFDSLQHRTLMAIAERTKSNIDATLYEGIQDQIEENSGGNSGEGPDDSSNIPTKPAHWATVWDTLGYTDTGFIGDYLATDLAVTGMDYEIFLNHTVPDKTWNVYLQENHINASRQIIKTAMAYALFQKREFRNFELNTRGRAGYLDTNNYVTDRDKNGAGTLPGPNKNGKGQDGKQVRQRHYRVTNLKWFKDTSRFMTKPFAEVQPSDVAKGTRALKSLDTLVLADSPSMPKAPGAEQEGVLQGSRVVGQEGRQPGAHRRELARAGRHGPGRESRRPGHQGLPAVLGFPGPRTPHGERPPARTLGSSSSRRRSVTASATRARR